MARTDPSPAPAIDFRVVFDAASSAMLIADATTHAIVDVNATWTKTTGLSREAAIATPALAQVRWDTDEHRAECLAQLERDGQMCECIVSVRRDGHEMAHRISGRIIAIDGRRLVLWELRDVREELREHERSQHAALWHRALLQSTVDGICIFDQNKAVIETNDRFAEMIGYSTAELIGTHPWDWDTRYTERSLDELLASNPTGSFTIETEHRRKDGSLYEAEVTIQRARITGRDVGVTVVRDITSRKRTEARLRASEEKYRGIFDESVAAIVVTDNEKRFVDCNQAAADLLGYTRDELLSLCIADVDADPVEVLPAHGQLFSGGRLINYVHRLRRKDHSIVTVLNNSRPLTDDSGAVVGLQSTLIDITERERAEKRLADSEQRLRLATSAARMGVWEYDFAKGELFWSPEIFGVFGLQPCEPSRALVESIEHAEDKGVSSAAMQRAIAERSHYHAHYRVTAGGATKWVEDRALIEYAPDGRPLRAIGLAQDITERKLIEHELERHREQLERLVDERTAELRETLRKMADTQFAMDRAGIGIVWAEPKTGRFLYVNDHHANLLGYSPQELLQLRVSDINPDFPAREFSAVQERIRQQGLVRLETRHRTKSGELIPVDSTIYYLRGATEDEGRFIAFTTDITRRKEHEQALLRAKQSAEAASEANAALVKQLEVANHKLSLSDHRLTAMFAISQRAPTVDEREVLRATVEEAARLCESAAGFVLCVEDDQQWLTMKCQWPESAALAEPDERVAIASAGLWADAVRTQRPVIANSARAQRESFAQSGAEWTRIIAVPVVEAGRVRLVMGVANKSSDYGESDVSQLQLVASDLWSILQRRRAASALVEAKKAAESANIAKSAFLANMSHEIRTPLNAITGMVYLIRRSGVSAEQRERLDKIEQAGLHLLEIINAVLDLSKIEAGKFTIEETELDLGVVLENVASLLFDQASAKNLQIVIESRLTERRFLGDATRLQQGLLNYGSNAIKFTQRGPVVLRAFAVESDESTALIRFEVEDRGIGVDPDKLHRLFTAFEQADNSTTRKYGGTGLGLAITKKLAQLMSGDAGVTSEVGQGSVFWFTARLKRHAFEWTPAPSPTVSAEAILARDYADARLLLVEDEPVNREVTLMLLSDIWPNVDVAEDGEQAVQMSERHAYDLILMDMQMPNMDGIDATMRIRRLPDRQSTPIIAMTANAFSEDRQSCFSAGMNDFLSKPVDPDVLFEMILRWLRK